jgi:hypothetical protein
MLTDAVIGTALEELPNVKDEPRLQLARLVRQHEA